MSFRLSTGLRNAMLGSTGFKGAFDGGKLCVFSGTIPADADADEGSGVKLLEITVDGAAMPGGGINYAAPVDGTVNKAAAETWQGDGLADNTASWFRIYDSNETTGASTTAVRLDGTVGISSGDMRMSSTTVVTGAISTASSAEFTLPATI